MSSLYEKQVKAALFETLCAPLGGEGFVLKAKRERFLRSHDGVSDGFQPVCLDAKPGWRIQPNVGLRFDRVEEIFHRTSGFDSKHQNGTSTIGGSVGSIMGGTNRTCEFLLEAISEVDFVAAKIEGVFREFALPYYHRYTSLIAVDAELNNNPTERTASGRAPWLRCSSGIIVAKLVDRRNYNQLSEIYKEVMSKVDKGFYLERFDHLLVFLETVEPGSGSPKRM